MEISFSKHALEMLQFRDISKSTILKILENPDEIIFENKKKYTNQLLWRIITGIYFVFL